MNNRILKIGLIDLFALGFLITTIGFSLPNRVRAATTLCVTPAAGGCYGTIGAALNAAHSGDTIRVAANTYIEYVVITQTVTLQGGWNATFTARDPNVYPTVIRPPDASFSVVDIEGQTGDPAAVTPTLDGFVITGGGGGNHGGGLRARDSNAVISNNIITGNVSYLLGGGIWVQRGAPRIENNHIENNYINSASSTGTGGGIELENTQATLIGNVIAHNFISDAVAYGGGLAIDSGGPVILTGNTILSNAAASITDTLPQSDVGYGGGLYVWNAPVNLTGNLIQSNAANAVPAFGFGGAYGYGGGVYIVNTSAFTLTDNTIVSNTAGYKYYAYLSGGGLQIESSVGLLNDNVIGGNHANGNILFGNGGGAAIFTSTLNIQGGQILNNVTSINCEGYGGGVYAFNSSVSIDAAWIENNCAANTPFYGLGGGLAVFSTPYTLTNAIIDNNRAYPNDTSVGGLYANVNSPGFVVNNSFVNNKGQGIRVGAPITLTNNLIMSHTTGISLTAAVAVSATYNDFYANATQQRGFSLDSSNFSFNPQLDGSYHLKLASVLIDAGVRSIDAPDHDIDGNARPALGTSGFYRFDIGADEYPGLAQVDFDLGKRSADLTIIGPGNPIDNAASDGSNDWIGFAVLGGDINNDQRDDLIVGAPNLSGDFDGGTADDGRVFSLYNNHTRRTGLIDLLVVTPSLEIRSWLNQQHIGRSFAAVDVTGDNVNDLIIGSIGGDDNGKPVTGTVYIFNGGVGLSGTRTLSPTMQAQHRIISDQSTQSFADKNELAAGQLNNSGASDIAVGESDATALGRSNAGAVYVFFGSSSLPSVWDMRVLSASLSIYGEQANDELGEVALGDVNGDGKLDLVARSSSKVYVFYGPLSAGVRDLASTSASATITNLGAGPLAVGDVDGDGQADILTGNGNEVVLVRGGTLASTQNVSAVAVDHITGLGATALRAFDWNHDGQADMIIGDSFNNRAFVFMGSAASIGTADVLDADESSDLIIGSRSHVIDDRADPHFNDVGAVYVFYGGGTRGPLWPYQVYLPLTLKQF